MQRDMIQNWLDLPPGDWPPDHYTLLGLARGESDVARIEQHVNDRMQRLREFQLANPEPATEAMNRLAQALICLTSPAEKQTYDEQLSMKPLLEATPVRTTSLEPATPPADDDPAEHRAGQAEDSRTKSAVPSQPTVRLPADQSRQTIRQAPRLPSSSRRWSNRRTLLAATAQTRRLIDTWEQIGKYLNRPSRAPSRPADANNLIRQMHTLQELVRARRLPLGEAGRPGHLVLTLARQEMIVPTLQTLLPGQREALSRDWQTGRTMLLVERDSLRRSIELLRGRSRWRKTFRSLAEKLVDHSGLVLLLLGLVALNLATPRLRFHWRAETGCLALLGALRFVWWWLARESAAKAAPHSPPGRG